MTQLLLERFLAAPAATELVRRIESGARRIDLRGLAGSGPVLLLAGLALRFERPLLLVTSDTDASRQAGADLGSLSDRPALVLESAGRSAFHAGEQVIRGRAGLAVVDEATLARPRPRAAAPRTLATGAALDPDELTSWLVEAGYEFSDLVTEPFEYARRGGIIDLYPPDEDAPLRVEFLASTIESVRRFDPISQRSSQVLGAVEVWGRDEAPGTGPPLAALLPAAALVLAPRPLGSPAVEICCESAAPDAVDFGQTEANLYLGNFTFLRAELAGGPDAFIFCGSEHQCARFASILGPGPRLLPRRLSCGVVDTRASFLVLTERELYGAPVTRPPRRRFRGLPVDDLIALRPGDHVVHVDYGVGLFQGVRRLEVETVEKDFIEIHYAGGGKVFLPVENLGLVDRYVGAADETPTLDRLGSPSWLRARARVARATEAYASELLEVYARRELEPGHAFAPDQPEQALLEASFPYAETPDQLAALADVKRDMEARHAMDRLVCGDVGYGKTELAVRAAAKAVFDGRQVAVLAPTTILCYQHYHTFRQRLTEFPVRVEMLSRFVPRPRQKEILADLARGRVDIVIGTHMLLGPRVRFADLGLLVIDEEQKFGVRQKERLKQLKAAVDVLVLTATPIPRTLYLSLVGLRNISMIKTPPAGRREIETAVAHWDDALVGDYLRRELARHGQAFFIHNRIRSLRTVAERLRRTVPEARVAVAHGQMDERELAEIYLAFRDRAFDLLVSTAIIESGLDLPNVNTILVDRAHEFGLADLHQLRGRVGRSDRQAYALFLVPADSELDTPARKRLSAVLAYSNLGAGFRLAMRDMEIRGVGSILGAEQHGHVNRIGFALYCQLLKQAVARLRGMTVASEPELAFDLPAYIPETYIAESAERVAIYKRLLAVEEAPELDALKEELRDRFGRGPAILDNLFAIARVRLAARRHGLRRVQLRRGEIVIERVDGSRLTRAGDLARLEALLARLPTGPGARPPGRAR